MDTFRKNTRPVTKAEGQRIEEIKDAAIVLHSLLLDHPDTPGLGGRELALARTSLEQAIMWAVKGITTPT